MQEIETVYARAGEGQQGSQEVTEDTVGTVQFEFVDWQERRKASVIIDEIRAMTKRHSRRHHRGDEARRAARRPASRSRRDRLASIPELLFPAALKAADIVRANPDTRDVDDGLPLPGIDWQLDVDKAEAAKYGASPLTVGTAVQLVTNGVKISEYRPATTDKSVDILVRFPEERRSLDQLDELTINTPSGAVPIGNFVDPHAGRQGRADQPRRRLARRHRHRQRRRGRAVGGGAGRGHGRSSQNADLGEGVTFQMKGEDEEREAAGAFLMQAFGAAIFLIFAILLAQFNKFSSVLLVLSAVVLSTIGVLIGLMVMGQAFGVVMTGIGIIANAGVIVNNNIVLIDTYDRLRREGVAAYEAILETCRERARPVVLTAVTAMLGVLAIAFGINIDFVERTVLIGAPSTQWWIHLSTAIVFGLGFATILTLIVTPAALMALANLAAWRVRRRGASRRLLGSRFFADGRAQSNPNRFRNRRSNSAAAKKRLAVARNG